MLTLLTQSVPLQDVPLKEVRVPDGLFWYMGIIVAICVVVFFVIPVVLSAKRKRAAKLQSTPQTETPADADHA